MIFLKKIENTFVFFLFILLSIFSACNPVNQTNESTVEEAIQEQDKYLKCESFIRDGVRYWFNHVLEWQETVPITHIKYDHGEIIVNGNSLRMLVGNIYYDFHIDKAIYEKINNDYQDDLKDVWPTDRAQFVLSSGGQKFYAFLELGYSQKFLISRPTSSGINLNYYPDESHLPGVDTISYGISYTFDIQRY